ncbi:ABC transporter permease [Opitutus sp. ER46]|uniref:ABC transporter permease n=1 Tax=Opitutus sp. ER46 TaxID=2161864 RepID=UPI000D30A086|nr:ABC transporter permease [Opitutus sp. ER46]PTX91336.1 permease [Opitutus sp. ER46]
MLVQNFVQDARVGVRMLLKEKSFSVLAVLVLALGIGGVATTFSVVNAVMLRGFSYPNADRLAGVQVINVTDPTQRVANLNGFGSQIFPLDFEEMVAQQRSFERLAAYISGSTVNMTIDGTAWRFTGAYVTQDFFRALGVAPILGRNFTAEDNKPGAEKVALLSHELWQSHFAAAPTVVGKAVRINGRAATVIGVMPPGFRFPVNEQLWVPLYAEFPPAARNSQTARVQGVSVLGALGRGVAFEQAQAEFTGIARRLAAEFPDTNKGYETAAIRPLIKSFLSPALSGQLLTMLGFCLIILLIACVNVMNMQFARAALRAKELAVRSSLGATRSRLIRQMLTESLIVALIGAVFGVGVAAYATGFLQDVTHNLANPLPDYIVFNVDGRVLAIAVVAAMMSAVVSGFVPAWVSSRASAVEALKESGRGNTSRSITLITRGLVAMQILLSCILLIGALLEVQSVVRQQRIDYGYDTQAVLVGRMGLMDAAYPTGESRKLFFDRLLRELRNHPEFEQAALTNRFRMTFSGAAKIEIEGRAYRADDSDRPLTNFEQVSDGYFETLGVKRVEGRDFAADDEDRKLPVAIVNAAFARKYFGQESAVGRRFRTVVNNGQLFGPWRTIVGVVQTTRMVGPFNNPNLDEAGFYVPYFGAPTGPLLEGPFPHQFATIVVRPRGGASRVHALAPALQREVNRVDPDLPLYFVGSAQENQATFIAPNRIIAGMFTLFGAVAVLLASVGLYGVTSFSVNQRTQEFGIRMALGADRRRILTLVLRQGAYQYVIGAVLGLGLTLTIALIARQAIVQSALLFEVSPADPATYLGVAALLGLVALVATIIPARRATRVDPMVALRAE